MKNWSGNRAIALIGSAALLCFSFMLTACGGGTKNTAPTPSGTLLSFTAVNSDGSCGTTATSALGFSYLPTMPNPDAQVVCVSTTSETPVTFNALYGLNKGSNWLTAAPGNGSVSSGASEKLTISAFPGSLSKGTYTGWVAVTTGGTSASTAVLSVTLTVANKPDGPVIQVLPATLENLTSVQNGADFTESLVVRNLNSSVATTMALKVSSSTTDGGNWLSVSPTTGVAPLEVIVKITPAGLTPGTYTGTVVVTSTTDNTQPTQSVTIPVQLTVTAPS